jgi:predicted ATP-dependent protease
MDDLERFINYNSNGIKRNYKPTRRQINRFKNSNSWVEANNALWTYSDYKTCYLTVRKDKDRYIPRVNGASVAEYPDVIQIPETYNSLDEAMKACIAYVDAVNND